MSSRRPPPGRRPISPPSARASSDWPPALPPNAGTGSPARPRREIRRFLDCIDATLERRGRAPAWWAADLLRYRERLLEAMHRPDYPVALDVMAFSGPLEADAETARLLADYGLLLQAWPALTAAARRVRQQGGIDLTLG